MSWAFGIARDGMSKEEACLRIELPKYEGREKTYSVKVLVEWQLESCACLPSCLHPLPQPFPISSTSFLVLSHSPYKK